MKRSKLVLGLTSLALVLGGCSGKAPAKDEGKAVAASTKPNPWSKDEAIAAAEEAAGAKDKKKPEPPKVASNEPKLNAWSPDDAIAKAEAEKAAKNKKK